MLKSTLVDRVNTLMLNGLYTYEQMEGELDLAIDQINLEMNSSYPVISEVFDASEDEDPTYDLFPEQYIRNIVINFVVAALYRREGEFGNEFAVADTTYRQWIGNMQRDYFLQVPEEYQNLSGGMIHLDPNTAIEKIIFESNGGSDVATRYVTYNDRLAIPRDPTKDGYTFDAWYTTSAMTVEYDFTKQVRTSFTLYAKWIEA